MNERQKEIALAISRLAASLTGSWISVLIRMLSSQCPNDRTAAVMLLSNLASGSLPPLPVHTSHRLSEEVRPVLETIQDPDLYTLCSDSLMKLQAATQCQPPGKILPVWIEKFCPSRN